MQRDAVLLDCGLRDMAFDEAAGCEADASERFVNCGNDMYGFLLSVVLVGGRGVVVYMNIVKVGRRD